MIFKTLVSACALLALIGNTLARPEGQATMPTLSAGNVRQIQETLKEVLPLYRSAVHKEHSDHGKLSIVHLILIIGKVLAPLVGAIVEPLLVNIAKGITWAITYSLATGFDKPPSYEHFVPALEHYGVHGGEYGHGGEHSDGNDDDNGGEEYESHKPDTYSLKELPGLAVQLTSTVLSESGQQPEYAQAMENAERKLVGLLLQANPEQ